MSKVLSYVFGYVPTYWPTWAYNSFIGLSGCWMIADNVGHFIGYSLILESLIVSIERCWPKGERPEENSK